MGILATMYPGITIRAMRESLKAAEQNLVAKFQEIYPEKLPNGKRLYKYNKQDKRITWFNPNGHVTIQFDYCESYQDALNKQGLEQDILIIDEACNHEERTLAYLEGRTRSNKLKPKIIYTGNWIGKGLVYLRKEYYEDTEAGTYVVNKIRTSDDGLRSYEYKYVFIPAKLADNKYLMETGYEGNLLSMDSDLRKALLDGDPYITQGKDVPPFGEIQE